MHFTTEISKNYNNKLLYDHLTAHSRVIPHRVFQIKTVKQFSVWKTWEHNSTTCLCIRGGSKNARMGQIGDWGKGTGDGWTSNFAHPPQKTAYGTSWPSPLARFSALSATLNMQGTQKIGAMPAKQKRYKTSHYLALDIHYKPAARLGSAIPCTAESARAVVEQVFSGPLVRNLEWFCCSE